MMRPRVTLALALLVSGCITTKHLPLDQMDEGELFNLAREKAVLCHTTRPPGGKAYLADAETLCLSGAIDERMVSEFEQVEQTYRYIVMRSFGGWADAGARIGTAISALPQETVAIPSVICFSSCANYLFLSTDDRIVMADAVVGWHGGPLPADLRNPRPTKPEVAQLEYQRHVDFFTMTGIDESIVRAKEWPLQSEARMESYGVKNTYKLSLPALKLGAGKHTISDPEYAD